MSYEWEDAKKQESTAKTTAVALGAALIGAAFKYGKDKMKAEEDKKKAEEERVIAQKRSRLNDLEAKWFLSEEQKAERNRLRHELDG